MRVAFKLFVSVIAAPLMAAAVVVWLFARPAQRKERS